MRNFKKKLEELGYYKKKPTKTGKGHRITFYGRNFPGGISQSELALELAKVHRIMHGSEAFDSGVISKMFNETGKERRNFTNRHLYVFCEVLGFSEDEKVILKLAHYEDTT